ncbi:MAG: PilW family protein [Gemmatimonadales bacterium]
MKQQGFTLVESVISMLLLVVVASTLGGVVIASQRFYRQQTERAGISANLREGLFALEMDLRGLDAGDSLGSDIVHMEAGSLTVKVVRSVAFLCRAPDIGRFQVIMGRVPIFGLRHIDPARDSILIWVARDAGGVSGDRWLRADIRSVSYARGCPGKVAGITVQVAGLTRAELAAVRPGSAIRAYQQVRYLQYRGGDGQIWLGVGEWKKGRGWTSTQPVAGPLAPGGLRFTYLDGVGNRTAIPANVAAIQVVLVGVGTRTPKRAQAGGAVLRDSLSTLIALRNNPMR